MSKFGFGVGGRMRRLCDRRREEQARRRRQKWSVQSLSGPFWQTAYRFLDSARRDLSVPRVGRRFGAFRNVFQCFRDNRPRRFFVSYFFIPIYYKDGIISIYQIIGDKFGPIVQKLASITFLITRFLADGVRFLATSVVLHIITGWNLQVSILIIGVITIFYSSIGGLKTILWIDGFQFFVYLVCGFVAIFYISNYAPLSYTEVSKNGFFNIFNFASNLVQFLFLC